MSVASVGRCAHADRRAWHCLLCGYDFWPARRVELLREYGARQVDVAAAALASMVYDAQAQGVYDNENHRALKERE